MGCYENGNGSLTHPVQSRMAEKIPLEQNSRIEPILQPVAQTEGHLHLLPRSLIVVFLVLPGVEVIERGANETYGIEERGVEALRMRSRE